MIFIGFTHDFLMGRSPNLVQAECSYCFVHNVYLQFRCYQPVENRIHIIYRGSEYFIMKTTGRVYVRITCGSQHLYSVYMYVEA